MKSGQRLADGDPTVPIVMVSTARTGEIGDEVLLHLGDHAMIEVHDLATEPRLASVLGGAAAAGAGGPRNRVSPYLVSLWT